MTSILILLLSALMFTGCCHGESSYSQNVEILDIERALDNISDIKLSKYASEIKYIPLSFDSEALLGNIGRVIFTDEHFYFKSSSLCLIHSWNKSRTMQRKQLDRVPELQSTLMLSVYCLFPSK